MRGIGVGVLALMSAHHDTALLDQLSAWDGQWYLGIAEEGYRGHGADTVDAEGRPYEAAPFAFFPALPVLMSIIATLGVSLPMAGLIVTTVAGVIAVPAIMRLARHVSPRPQAGLLLVTLTAAAPMSITLSMIYTEAVFVALAAWALVGVLERRWALAGVCTMLAGLSRSSAAVLAAVVVAAALWSIWHERAGWRPLIAVVLAPAGLLTWWTTVAVATGSTWQAIEWRGWHTRWDWGQEAVEWISRVLTTELHVWETASAVIVLAAIGLAALLVMQRVPWPLAAYGAGIVVLTIGSSGLPFAKPRFLLVGAMVLLIPVAAGLTSCRMRTITTVMTVYVLGGAWLSGYALTVWPYAI